MLTADATTMPDAAFVSWALPAGSGVETAGPTPSAASHSPSVVPAAPAIVFEGRDEEIYQAIRQQLLLPDKPGVNWLALLLLSLVAFIALQGQDRGVGMILLVATLFFHEGGHWLGMKAFGFRDVKMFFIPMFGAAVSGKKVSAPQWQKAVVSLLGPLPGIYLGCFLLIVSAFLPEPHLRTGAFLLIGLNCLNLLPIGALDGAQFLNAVVFSRHPLLETVFGFLTSLGMIAASIAFETWLLAVWGAFGLISLPATHRIAKAARLFEKHWINLPPEIRDAGDPAHRDLFRAACQVRLVGFNSPASQSAKLLGQIYQRANSQRVPAWGTVLLLAVYASGFAAPLVASIIFGILNRNP